MANIKAAIVFLYGCDINSPLKLHLDNVVRVGHLRDIRHYILCGGASQQNKFPGLTEACVAYEYLRDKVPLGSRFYLEENSLTSSDNARNGAWKLHEIDFEFGGVSQVFVFVEALRALKAAGFFRHFLPEFHPGTPDKMIRFETESWEQMDPALELAKTNYDFASIRFPFLAWLFRSWRKVRSRFI